MTLKEGHYALVFSWIEWENGESNGLGLLWAMQVKGAVIQVQLFTCSKVKALRLAETIYDDL